MLTSETELIAALRRRDEAAFMLLVERYHNQMVRLARSIVGDSAVAEEVAQEAWVGVLRGVARFEGRSSLQTWIFTILTNCARTRAVREQRTWPFADWFGDEEEPEPSVDPARFQSGGRWQGHWLYAPVSWRTIPEEHLLAQETLALIQQAIDALPLAQRTVIQLRDVEGLSAAEVCNILQIGESNQRVLLHRARAKVQRTLAHYLGQESPG